MNTIYCPRCKAKANSITDIDGETLPECIMCGWRGYKTPEEMGIDVTNEGEFSHQHSIRVASPDANGNLMADSGCRWATAFLKRQSRCFECPFPECTIDKYKQTPKEEADERDRRIIELKSQGVPARRIVRELGIKESTYWRIMSKHRLSQTAA